MFDADKEIRDANRRISARINENARAAYARIDPHCVEASPAPSGWELLGGLARQIINGYTLAFKLFARGFERGTR